MKNKLFTLFRKKKILCVTVLLVLLAVIKLFTSAKIESENENSEDVTDPGQAIQKTTGELSASTSVGAPEVKDPVDISKDATKDGWFFNAYYGFCFQLPEDFTVKENQNIIYIRNEADRTQIALIYLKGSYADGIEVYNHSNSYVYKQKALLEDKNGMLKERPLQSYGRGHKETKTVGSFTTTAETGTAYYADAIDMDFIKTFTNNYFTTFHGNGIALMGISQTQDNDAIFQYMDGILSTWKSYEPKEQSLELATFQDNTTGIAFDYPARWEVSEDENHMIIIKAPESQTNVYAGTIIEFFADSDHSFVSEYSQFSANYERQILIPTFVQEIKTNDFTYESAVTSMDINAKLKEKPCCYYEVTDRIFPGSRGIDASIGISGSTVYSKRWCFNARNKDCMLNIIVPPDAADITNIIIQSFQSN